MRRAASAVEFTIGTGMPRHRAIKRTRSTTTVGLMANLSAGGGDSRERRSDREEHHDCSEHRE